MDGQEIAALVLVILVVGAYVWRRRRQGSGCHDCASAERPKAESTVRFYRRSE